MPTVLSRKAGEYLERSPRNSFWNFLKCAELFRFSQASACLSQWERPCLQILRYWVRIHADAFFRTLLVIFSLQNAGLRLTMLAIEVFGSSGIKFDLSRFHGRFFWHWQVIPPAPSNAKRESARSSNVFFQKTLDFFPESGFFRNFFFTPCHPGWSKVSGNQTL